jgi:SAM-dependent methyltransferase
MAVSLDFLDLGPGAAGRQTVTLNEGLSPRGENGLMQITALLRRSSAKAEVADEAADKSSATDAPAPAAATRSLRTRLHAWWEGYDLPPVASASEDDKPETPAKPGAAAKPAAAAKTPAKELWSHDRIEVAQILWGKDFASPLGAATLAELTAPLVLEKNSTLMHLGCGLGGGTRALVAAHAVKATGMESSPALAKAGMELSGAAKLKAGAPIGPVDLGSVQMKPAVFDRAVIEHVLHMIDDKEAALARIVPALKPDARILVLDFIVQGKAPGPAIEAWAKVDPAPVKPWGLDAARKAFAKLNIDLSEVADQSERYRALIVHGLDEFLKAAASQAFKRTLTVPLKREVDIWAARMAAMDAGELKPMALYGVKAR